MKNKPIIILADSNKADRLIFKIAMDEIGLEAKTIEISDSKKLLEFANSQCKAEVPKFIVLDLQMSPKLNSFEALRYLHNNPDLRDVPVIVLTSHGEDNTMCEAMKLGVLMFLVKSHSLKEYKEVASFMKFKITESQ